MGLAKKFKHAFHRVTHYGMSRKQYKNIRGKLGLTSESRLARKIRRSLNLGSMRSQVPTSADSVGYVYQPRPISSLM